MTAKHRLRKSTAVKRKRARPKKQREESFDRSEELPDMDAELGLGKSYDVERKRSHYTRRGTYTPAVANERCWLVYITPSLTIIVALGRRRYSYHRCVDCGKKGLQDAEGKYCCAEHPDAETKETYRLRVLLRQGGIIIICGSLLSTRSRSQFWVFLQFSALEYDRRKGVAWGVSGMKWYMTVEKTQGPYTNYTIESMDPAGYFY